MITAKRLNYISWAISRGHKVKRSTNLRSNMDSQCIAVRYTPPVSLCLPSANDEYHLRNEAYISTMKSPRDANTHVATMGIKEEVAGGGGGLQTCQLDRGQIHSDFEILHRLW